MCVYVCVHVCTWVHVGVNVDFFILFFTAPIYYLRRSVSLHKCSHVREASHPCSCWSSPRANGSKAALPSCSKRRYNFLAAKLYLIKGRTKHARDC